VDVSGLDVAESEGQRAEFTLEDTPKGPQAVDVIGLDVAESEPAATYI
jgi:cold shock CspA family protein